MKDDNVTAFQIFRQHYPKGMIASCGKEYMHMVRDCILEDYRTSVAANMSDSPSLLISVTIACN